MAMQGLKPNVHLMGFIGLTKFMPFYKALGDCRCNEFFRSLDPEGTPVVPWLQGSFRWSSSGGLRHWAGAKVQMRLPW
jgi:hypothetical protein